MVDTENLWGDDFVIPEKEKTKKVLDKIAKPKKPKIVTIEKQVKSKTIDIHEKLMLIEAEVLRVLGKQKDNIICIKTKEDFHDYITKCIKAGRIDIDTETNNSLDPITCKIMGLCLYAPGLKQAYIPINHRNPDTKERLDWQLTEADIKEELQRVIDAETYVVMHNGKFDYQVIKCTCDGLMLPINWDTMIGAFLLDENEFSHGLKQQYISKIDPEQEKYDIEKLFEGVEYADVDPEWFAYYAATDSFMTDKLFEYQMRQFENPDLSRVLSLAETVEMPLVQVIAEMELAGMEVDLEYCDLLSKKYHKKLDDIDNSITIELERLKPKIEAWKLTPDALDKQQKKLSEKQYANAIKSVNYDPSLFTQIDNAWYKVAKPKIEQLDENLTPNSLASATQLAIVLYDILKCPVVNKEKPRATGEDELSAIAKQTDLSLCRLLIERREVVKLLTTYIDTFPTLASEWPDHRIRTHFNQYGADTGRLSSGGRIVFGPTKEFGGINYQNIPSHNKEIRLCFKAADGNMIIGSDYSGQEVRLTAHYANDPAMIKAYSEHKDLYAIIASMCFDMPYEECLEHNPDGSIYEEGKARRTAAKSVLLGLLYGRGAASIGEQIGKTKDEAQEIMNKFFKAFPTVQKWINDSIQSAHETGYVEDVAGRRRRLPDIQLPKYSIKNLNETAGEFNPFLGCANRQENSKIIDKYQEKLAKVKFAKEYEKIKEDALKEGIEIHSNTGFIAQAERQAVNSRVQGGAATLTKTALIDIYKNKRLQEMGAKIVNAIHDEILIEVKKEYADEAAKILTDTMVNAAKKYVPLVPMSCDPTVEPCWYLSEFFAVVEKEFTEMIRGNKQKNIDPIEPMKAFEILCEKRTESTRNQLYEIVGKLMPQKPTDVEIIHTLN